MSTQLDSHDNAPSRVDRKLERLASLQCTDPGFFVLATHSFVEGCIRERFGKEQDDLTFAFLMNEFLGHVKEKRGGFVNGLASMNAMITAHNDTNRVRHRFEELDRLAAEVATGHLERFCHLAGIGSPERLDVIKRYLALWDERKAMGALIEENRAYKAIRGQDAEEKRRLMERVDEMRDFQKRVELMEASLKAKDRLIEEIERQKDRKAAKAEAERQERAAIQEELRKTRIQLAGFEREREYVAIARKLTVFTRTRADYERTVIRLTAEQAKVVDQIKLDADFLVKGAAGTGKTLVLLKAIEKAKGGGTEAKLDLDEIKGSVALLTYGKTLVKYDKYIASILSPGQGADRIMTADAFLIDRLKAILPDAGVDYNPIDYKLIDTLAERHKPDGFAAAELRDEAERIVWGNDLRYEDYVQGGFERRGMKKPLAAEERAKVWTACEAMAAEMDAMSLFSRGYSVVKLLRAAKAAPDDERIRVVDYVFIDEAQDLAAADIKALKACARRAVILAGDSDQSIYQPGFSFKQAGLDVGGRSRVLRTNFRNTFQVHALAEAYRARKTGLDSESQPVATRDGALPEHFSAKDRQSLVDLLVSRVRFFREYLDYDPANICVLAPENGEVKLVIERLASVGISAENPKDDAFSFERESTVRVTTFHSAKGLDFPVVFLLLNRKPYTGSGYEHEVADGMTRNLIYVGMTRAMEHLDVFTLEEPGSGAIADLVACMAAQEGME